MALYIYFLCIEAWRRKINELINDLSKFHPTITFTAKSSKTLMTLLDTVISLIDPKIQTGKFLSKANTKSLIFSFFSRPSMLL